MPKVLLITADYPPGYQVGYARTTKFQKYLPEFGYPTCVLTMQSNGKLPSDSERRVYRAFDAGRLYLPFTRPVLNSPRHVISEYRMKHSKVALHSHSDGGQRLMKWFRNF